jgi:hypothetical protein
MGPIADPRSRVDSHRHERLERCLSGPGGGSLAGIRVTRRSALRFVDCVGIGCLCPVCGLLEHVGLEILGSSPRNWRLANYVV